MKPAVLGWAAAAAVLGVLVAAAGWGMVHAAKPSAQLVGRPAPQLVVRAFDGSTLRLSDLRGRPVVLNFWASWCAPCRQEDPALQAAAREHAGQVQFVGVDVQDSDTAARAYEAATGHPYPVGSLLSGDASAFGVTAPPTTVFVDGGGVVAARFAGPLDGQVLARYLQLVGVS
jgi:cytochrome c biogenesis protein CcmG, thiol:disulfide interchange protein DsbE